jgi:hypothetical protein
VAEIVAHRGDAELKLGVLVETHCRERDDRISSPGEALKGFSRCSVHAEGM